MTTYHLHPDWLIVGFPHSEGVAVIASTTLGTAELRCISGQASGLLGRPGPGHVELSGVMHRYVWITGADYGEALANLMRRWNPADPTAELEPATRALPEPT